MFLVIFAMAYHVHWTTRLSVSQDVQVFAQRRNDGMDAGVNVMESDDVQWRGGS